jgi:threonine/homoserine/homoserine lactone efflux protein
MSQLGFYKLPGRLRIEIGGACSPALRSTHLRQRFLPAKWITSAPVNFLAVTGRAAGRRQRPGGGTSAGAPARPGATGPRYLAAAPGLRPAVTCAEMVSSGHLLGFALASLVLIVIPGPSVLFIVGRALSYGRRTALATVCGNAAGNYVAAVWIAFGIGTLVERSMTLFAALKLAGALYLVWLGIQAIRRRKTLATAFAGEGNQVVITGRRAVRQGFIVGVTNPKALILFGAVLPQFVDRAAGDAPAQMLLLSLVSIAIGLTSDSLWGITASSVRTWFASSERRFELVGGAGGLAMIGVGLAVAVTGRTN